MKFNKVSIVVLLLFLVRISSGRKYKPNRNLRIINETQSENSTVQNPEFHQKRFNMPDDNLCVKEIKFDQIGQSAKIYSPNYPFDYPPNQRCFYNMASLSGTQMEMNCDDFNVEVSEKSDTCQYDQFRFSRDGDLTSPKRQFSCGLGSIRTTSDANLLKVLFLTDATNVRSLYPFRFACTIKVIKGPLTPTPVTHKPSIPEPATYKPVFPTTTPPQPIKQCSCGQPLLRKEARIVGGTDAGNGRFPWRCILKHEKLGRYCGCAVISPNWVITAAHCAIAAQEKGGPLIVDIGDYDLDSDKEAKNVEITVKKILKHEEYDKESQDNDLSLLLLNETLKFGVNIQPVCLPFKYIGKKLQGAQALATGWGLDKYGGMQEHILQKVTLTIYETEECRQKFPGYDQKGLITNNMFCTYEDNRDMCQGDSGGGIDIFDGERYYEVGISSWGIGCAARNRPGAYVKLTLQKFLYWIYDRVGDELCIVQ